MDTAEAQIVEIVEGVDMNTIFILTMLTLVRRWKPRMGLRKSFKKVNSAFLEAFTSVMRQDGERWGLTGVFS